MIIAIPSDNKEHVSETFGRCKCFVLYNTETKEINIVDNFANMSLGSGAGMQTATNLIKNKIDVIITYDLGPKANRVLAETDIKVIQIDKIDKINNLVDEYLKNQKQTI
ncbi:MAG TPA: NifB/NifX family molybdenum-iron cluster-binding protein [Spirochaetota bacterium]|nr:NifB/NifX family molybdenum-iron cluster-binding protein [Spirochaetota bacterium]